MNQKVIASLKKVPIIGQGKKFHALFWYIIAIIITAIAGVVVWQRFFSEVNKGATFQYPSSRGTFPALI